MKKTSKQIILITLILSVIGLFFLFDLNHYFTIENIKQQQHAVEQLYANNPIVFSLSFFIAYVVMAALSIPGAALMTLLAGSIFGLLKGSIIVSFASTIGASIAFLISRYLFKDIIQSKNESTLKTINDGIEKEGGYYLFSLRLVPAFPFFLINLVMGLTNISIATFYFVSQIGMLPATIIYVNAGKQLASINSLSEILSPNIIIAFVLLGLFPLIVKKVVDYFSLRQEAE